MRQITPLNQAIDANGNLVVSPIKIVTGNDHAVGRFVQIMDTRYAGCDQDEQGEGYVFDYDDLFKCSTNLLGIDTRDPEQFMAIIRDEAQLQKLCDAHLTKLGVKF